MAALGDRPGQPMPLMQQFVQDGSHGRLGIPYYNQL